jgi:zinc/manganese transport system substrate-binding protein
MRTPVVACVLFVMVAAGTTACTSAEGSTGSSAIRVVAAENFYGNLAQQIGGARVTVRSILSNPDADPHLFEPGSSTGLAVDRAKVVIDNGAGYDDWMSRLLQATNEPGRQVVTVADVLGVHGEGANPHLWYDTPQLDRIVSAIGGALAAADPGHRTTYEDGVDKTEGSLKPLQDAVAALRRRHAGAPVAYTERVPGYLLQAAGLDVRTPPSFARAIEDGTDPTPSDVAAMRGLISAHSIRALLYNEQAISPITARLRDLAKQHGVPVVAVTETMPPGARFQSWQLAQVIALSKALDQ